MRGQATVERVCNIAGNRIELGGVALSAVTVHAKGVPIEHAGGTALSEDHGMAGQARRATAPPPVVHAV